MHQSFPTLMSKADAEKPNNMENDVLKVLFKLTRVYEAQPLYLMFFLKITFPAAVIVIIFNNVSFRRLISL